MAPVTADASPRPFACNACGTCFLSRNALFRHLKEDSKICAKEGDFVEVEKDRTAELPGLPQTKLAQTTSEVAKKKEKGPPRKLQIDTRPAAYEEELSAKVATMRALFDADHNVSLPTTEVFASSPEHFRMRASFDIRHDPDGPKYVMFEGKDRVVVQHYPMAARTICDVLMPILLTVLRDEKSLLQQLFQVNFHTTLHGDAMVSLLYHTPMARAERKVHEELRQQAIDRKVGGLAETPKGGIAIDDDLEGPLTTKWAAAAERLRTALNGASIVGHCRGKKGVIGRDWVEEHLKVAGVDVPFQYQQLEGFFSQSNGEVAQHMLAWARAVAHADDAVVGASVCPPRSDDLLELYCGNGNFSIALASCFRRVLATELVKALVEAAKLNAENNGIMNAIFARVSAEELAQAMDGSRTFQRLAHIDLSSYLLRTVIVDPPRAGLGPEVATFIARFPRIVYISCNPETLHQDLGILNKTHDIKRIAAFDQFPYIDHLEMGALLVQRME